MQWLFTDMNAYFASVEQFLRPELRGQPVGVIPADTDNTCIIAASYDAKKFGVKTGTSVRDAKQLCRGIALVKARPDTYVKTHHRLLEVMDQCAPVHKVYSIDEWTHELLGEQRRIDQAKSLALQMKECLFAEFGPWITCSIGIAPSRLLAKIASDLQKPDGLTVLSVDDLPGRLESLALQDLCGIGQGMAARLESRGIRSVRELWNLTRRESIDVWGSVSGASWWAGFHGIDEPEVPTTRSSMSHANVLEPKFRNDFGAHGILSRLICRLGTRLRSEGYSAGCLSISLCYLPSGSFSDKVVLSGVQDTQTLLLQFDKLWQRRPRNKGKPLRVGACVSGLMLASQKATYLFDELKKPLRVCQAIDAVQGLFGMKALHFGATHEFGHLMDNKIAFGRIPPPSET